MIARAEAPHVGATDEVTRFLRALRRVRFAEWRRCAGAAAAPDAALAHAEPVLLECALDGVPRLRTHIGRRVAHVLAACDGLLTAHEITLMHRAACRAAGALAVRALIGRDEFERCYAPFAQLVPYDARRGS